MTKPNFVVILADDMGWGDPSCYPQQRWRPGGALDTPEIDRLAASGVKCMQAYATSPICNPSRAGLMTGRYQQHFGYYEFHEALAGIPKTVPTLAEMLKKQGYATAIYGKWHTSFRVEDGPLTRGFDQFYGFIGGQHDYYNPRIGELVNGVGFSDGAFLWDQYRQIKQDQLPDGGYLTDVLTQRAVSFIRDMGQSRQPFFLYLPYNCPHPPLQAKWEFLKKYYPYPHRKGFTERDLACAMIGSLDQGVGQILGQLKASGLSSNTLVIFSSDNGGGDDGPGGVQQVDYDGGLRGRKGFLWEGGIRIPFIVSWPGHLPAGATYEQPVSHLDVAATLTALSDPSRQPAPNLDGVNLLPYLSGQESGAPHAALFWGFAKDTRRWAVRDGDWKLTSEYPNPDSAAHAPDVREVGLFNLDNDPDETNNVIAAHPAKAQELQALVAGFYAQCLPSLVTPAEDAAWQQARKAALEKLGGHQDKLRRDGYPGCWR